MKKITIHLLFAWLVWGLSSPIVKAQPQVLTLQECLDKALEYNKSLSASKLKLEQARFGMKGYKANFFPQMNLMALDFYSTVKGNFNLAGGHLPIYNYVESLGQFVPNITQNADGTYTLNQYADFPSQSMKWKLKNMLVAGVSMMEPLYSGGKITAAYDMSKLGVGMANENIRLTESEVMVKTHEAYYLAVKAKELGEVARAYKTLLVELKKNVDGAFRHGMSTRNDMMKVQVKLNEAELSIQKADNGSRLALMNLCHIIGMPLDTPVDVLIDTVFVSPSEQGANATGTGISSRPEYTILEQKSEMARQQVKLAKSDLLPSVTVGATYIYANGGELAGKKFLDNGSVTVGVAVNMPIDLFGGTTSKVRSARAAYQIAQLEQQDLNEQMQLELAQCQNLYQEAQTELHLCDVALEQAAENVRLSRQQYEVGFESLSDLLQTQAMWQQCNADRVNARCQLRLSYIKLLRASGNLR